MKGMPTKNSILAGLKICGLCGVLNCEASTECYNCAWHGAFDTDSEHVQTMLLGGHHDGLKVAGPGSKRMPLLDRLRVFVKSLRRRKA